MELIVKNSNMPHGSKIEDINKYLDQQKKQQRIWSAFQNYSLHLQKYYDDCSRLTFQPPPDSYDLQYLEFKFKYSIFANPTLFIINKKHDIYCIRNYDLLFNKKNYPDVFHKLGYHCPTPEFIDSLYEVLDFNKIDRVVWKYSCYKFQNNCLNCIFDHDELFRIFDGNILFDDNLIAPKDSFLVRSTVNTLLYEETYKLPVIINNNLLQVSFKELKQPTLDQFKSIADFLRKPRFLETALPQQHNEQVLLQYIISFLKQNNYLDEFETDKKYLNSSIIVDGEVKHILNERKDFLASAPPRIVPENFIFQLSKITDGSETTIDQLAMLIARINLGKSLQKSNSNSHINNISDKLTILLTTNINNITTFFNVLYPVGRRNYRSIHELCTRKALIENIIFKYNGGILHIFEHGKSTSPDDLKLLKKFVKSVPVRKTDKAVGRLTYISNCHYILLAKKQEEVLPYKNYFQNSSQIIALNTQQTPLPTLTKYDYKWVHTIFATYGLLLLANENNSVLKKQKLLDINSVITAFLKECCIISPEYDCYANELYLLYESYVENNFSIEPVKKLHFVNILKANGDYSYYRPRHHKNDNRWGFKGISIRKEKLEEYMSSNTISQADQVENKIARYLGKINKRIRPLIGIENETTNNFNIREHF
jgi:hypothetical protein